MTPRPLTPLLLAVVLACACSSQPAPHAHDAAPATAARPVRFDNLGDYRRPVTTKSPEAQAYFDQGLRLTYGFNHSEAQAAFREAVRLDPSCAMCYWGVALTYGSNYNSPTDADRERSIAPTPTRCGKSRAAFPTTSTRAPSSPTP